MTRLDLLETLQAKASKKWPKTLAQIERRDPETGDVDPWFFAAGPESLNLQQADTDARFGELLVESSEALIMLAMAVHSMLHDPSTDNDDLYYASFQQIVEALEGTILPHGS